MILKELPSNQRVFTTTEVGQNGANIHYILMDSEGDIQVTGTKEVSSENAMIISMEQLLSLDSSLAEVNIEPNSRLFKATVDADWMPF
ncbi:MAG: hypothetical protein MI810_09060 [Flavobacteriales bacterium]|nr:hypothetical protein [Flavobacteriales bacterium]